SVSAGGVVSPAAAVRSLAIRNSALSPSAVIAVTAATLPRVTSSHPPRRTGELYSRRTRSQALIEASACLIYLALRELRRLAGALETRLLALLRARVAREQTRLTQRLGVLFVDLQQRA